MDNNNHSANILALPSEITICIFEYLLAHPDPNKSPYHGLLPVTQTSTHLRQTAMAAPSLWSIIEISDKPASFSFAKLCLSRSGNHKLDISMRVLMKMENKINGLLALLEFASPRIRSLSLKLGLKVGEQWNLWCKRMRVMDLGAMENFTFEVWRRGMTDDGMRLLSDIDVIALPDAVSSLRSLSLSQTSIAPNSLALLKLVHLTLRSALFGAWPYYHLFKVLQGCQALEELELMGSGAQLNVHDASYSADRLPSVPRIQCPNLRRLTFFAVENHMVSIVLTNLTAPSLDVVSLETPKGFKPDIPFTWIRPPNPIPFDSVRVLLITDRPGLDLDHQDHFALLLATLFPGIERMEIPSIRCRPLLTTWGEPVNIALNPWKDLQSIVLKYREDRCFGHSDEIMQETLRFLTARRRFGCPPLKRLRLGGCDKCQYSDRDRVEGGIKRVLESIDALEPVKLIHYSAADQWSVEIEQRQG